MINSKNLAIAQLLLMLCAVSSAAMAEVGKFVYYKICYYCHDDGLVGAPKIGDEQEWKRRQKKGTEVLYQNSMHGAGHMMERLNRRGYNEIDIKNAVDFLLKKSN